jgi:hypothetical protein
MRSWIALLALILLPCEAKSSHVHDIVIVEPGIYQARTIKTIGNPFGVGRINTVDSIKLMKSTTIVPAREGVRFGFRYIIKGAPKGSRVELRLSINFPTPGLRIPHSQRIYLRNEYFATKTVGSSAYREFQFEHDWEIVPGLWTFEFWEGDRKVGEQSFCVQEELTEDDSRLDRSEKCTAPLVG